MSAEAQNEPAQMPVINGTRLGPTVAKMLEEEGTEAELLRASVYGDVQRVRNLVDADPRLLNLERGGPKGTVRWGPILLASMYGQHDVVEALLDRGAPLSQNWHSGTLLHHAAQNRHTQVVELLIQRGADVNALAANTSARVTPLLRNVFQTNGGNEEIVRLLLEAGADPEIRTGDWSALAQAAGAGNIPVVKILLAFGADVNTRTPVYASSWSQPYSDDWPIVEPDWRDTRPLYGAVCTGSLELVELLLDHGADINALSFGWTALHAAAGQGNRGMVELLLARGADIQIKSSNNKTAIELLSGHKKSAELLRHAMDRT